MRLGTRRSTKETQVVEGRLYCEIRQIEIHRVVVVVRVSGCICTRVVAAVVAVACTTASGIAGHVSSAASVLHHIRDERRGVGRRVGRDHLCSRTMTIAVQSPTSTHARKFLLVQP